MKHQPTYHHAPRQRAVAVQLRALADAIQRTDSPPKMMAEASRAVARDLQSLAREYVPHNGTGKG